jgi:Fe-S-cluster containining protein
MTNSFVEMSALAAGTRGETVSCRMGCAACCRQPVPISEIEIYYFAELVEALPEPRRTEVKERFSNAIEHFKSIGWFDRIREVEEMTLTESKQTVTDAINDLGMEYFREGVPCPFLDVEAGACTIHETRPVACREYLVTSPAANCSQPSAESIRKVELVMQPSHTLRYVGSTSTFTGFIPLIKALELAERFPEKLEERTGERWAADFFSKLTHQDIPKAGISPEKKSN